MITGPIKYIYGSPLLCTFNTAMVPTLDFTAYDQRFLNICIVSLTNKTKPKLIWLLIPSHIVTLVDL